MSFSTLYPGLSALVLSEQAPGTLVKSPYEKLDQGPAGRLDQLKVCYHGVIDAIDTLNDTWLDSQFPQGDLFLSAATSGTWVIDRVVPKNVALPCVDLEVHLLGQSTAKPDAVRWFANTESQQGENILADGVVREKLQARILSVGVEIDTVVIGAEPDMSSVGDNATPPSAPSVRASDWTGIEEPTYHYRNGWVLVDIRTQQIGGSALVWLATYVYNYIYPYSP